MGRRVSTLRRALPALAVLLLLGTAGSARADVSLSRVGSELRLVSGVQDGENLVIFRGTNAVDCDGGAIPCIAIANSPQAITGAAAGCTSTAGKFVACAPVGAFTTIRLTLRDGNDFAKVLSSSPTSLPPVIMDGGPDDDTLDSRAGADTLLGGPGEDTLLDDDATAADTIDGGEDDDVIVVGGGDDDVKGGDGNDSATLDPGDDTVTLDDVANDGPLGAAKNIHSDIEVVDGGAGSDNLFGNAGANTLLGGAGNDIIFGGDGDDVLEGGTGADDLNGQAGADEVRYTDASAQVITLDNVRDDGAAGELDNVHSDIERVAAGAGDDVIVGSDADNRLDGGDGNDVIDGRGGVDTLLGGAGGDTIAALDGLGDTIDCGPDADTGQADTVDTLAGCENVAVSSELLPKTTLRASVSFRYAVFRKFTRLRRLKATQLSGGERIELRCKGRGCKVKKKVLTAKDAGRRNLRKYVKRSRFRAHAKLKIFITKTDAIGRYRKFKFRRAKAPKIVRRCLVPGSSKPVRCP
jgi:Ca2+-binding RTX toxin-like protein